MFGKGKDKPMDDDKEMKPPKIEIQLTAKEVDGIADALAEYAKSISKGIADADLDKAEEGAKRFLACCNLQRKIAAYSAKGEDTEKDKE